MNAVALMSENVGGLGALQVSMNVLWNGAPAPEMILNSSGSDPLFRMVNACVTVFELPLVARVGAGSGSATFATAHGAGVCSCTYLMCTSVQPAVGVASTIVIVTV